MRKEASKLFEIFILYFRDEENLEEYMKIETKLKPPGIDDSSSDFEDLEDTQR